MSKGDSDQHLKNLRTEETDGNPPPKPVGPNANNGTGARKKKTRKPNKRGGAARISARRIGGPDLQQDFESYRNAKMAQQGAIKSQKSGSSSRIMAVPTAPVQVTNLGRRSQRNSLGGTLPRVQELGGHNMSTNTVSARRSSSRINLGNLISRSRSSSSASNHSGGNAGDSTSRETIIRYGELLKKGVVTNKWKRRFFVLTDKHLLYFVDTFDVPQELHQIDVAPKGQIELAIIDEIRKDKKDPSTFHILAPTRTYRLRMEASDEKNAIYGTDAWVAAISGAFENAKQQHQTSTRAARGSFASYKVDEMDNANFSASTYKHPAKRLIDSEFQGGGPHTPASFNEVVDWTPFDVSAWLYTVHLQQYSEVFYQQQVDGQKLKAIATQEDAKAVGVEEEDISKFMEAIETLSALNMLSENPL